MPTIQPNMHATVSYTLRDDDGKVIDASDWEGGEPIAYVHGYEMLVPGLEAGLLGLTAGDERKITVTPQEGYGDRDEELVFSVERGEFPDPKSVSVGDEFVAEGPDGEEIPMRVREVFEEEAVVDANHPLAGKTLHYSVRVIDVRAATAKEVDSAAEELDLVREAEEEHAEALVQLGKKK